MTFTRIVLLLSLFVCSYPAWAAVDLGVPTSETPYDRYMEPVQKVLRRLDGEADSMRTVLDLMSKGRDFRYSHTTPYVAAMPQETAATQTGDCKDKSLWLCAQLNDSSVRFVVGKARRTAKMSHAWVIWKHKSAWWILDCTNTRRPIRDDRVRSDEYIPLYSYSKTGSFRHASSEVNRRSQRGFTRKESPVAADLLNRK